MGDVREFLLPDLGEGLEEAEIVDWLVQVGDRVALNQEIVEVETAKAVVAVPCPFAGTLHERFGEPGETLAVGQLLCRIEVGSESSPMASPPETPSTAAKYVEEISGLYGEVKETAPTGLHADEEPQPLVGYGQRPSGRRRRRPTNTAHPTSSPSSPQPDVAPSAPLAKPPVRQLAKRLGVDLADIAPGSGPDGIITRDDVHAAAEGSGAGTSPIPEAPVHRQMNPQAPPGFRERRPGEIQKVQGIRKRIIAKMEQSRRDIPHALCATDADLTTLWELRQDLTAAALAQGYDVTISPTVLVARATCLALRRFPTLNAIYDQTAGEIRLLEPIHLGVAVDTDRGLIVPNIKHAHAKSTLQLALELAELAQKCRNGIATPAELTGGTFTVDNYGYFGNDDGNPIINAPEVGILGIGAIRERPWIRHGQITVRRVARLQLAFDHRVCDGGEAGRFVAYVADLCEDPARLLLHA